MKKVVLFKDSNRPRRLGRRINNRTPTERLEIEPILCYTREKDFLEDIQLHTVGKGVCNALHCGQRRRKFVDILLIVEIVVFDLAKSELIVHNCEKYVSSYFTCKIGTKKSLSRPKSKPFKLKTRASRETDSLDKIPVG